MNKNIQVKMLPGVAAAIGGLDSMMSNGGNQGEKSESRNPLFNTSLERVVRIRRESRAKQAAKEARRAARFK